MLSFSDLRVLIIVLILLTPQTVAAAQNTLYSDNFDDSSINSTWSISGGVSEHDGLLDIHNPGDCSYDTATLDLGDIEGNTTFSFSWIVDISGWYENPKYEIREDGNVIQTENFPKSKDGHYEGSWTRSEEVNGQTEIEFLVEPSGACGNGDHYHTDLKISNLDITVEKPEFCDFRGLNNECIMNKTRNLEPISYNITSEFWSQESARINSTSGTSILNITNSTSISGLWRGSFFINTERSVLTSGAHFIPENGDIVIGN